MIEVERPADLAQYVGKEIGVSDWFTVDQAIIDKFADATGDHQWIHVDVERAKREMPGGKTIAHGYLTLSLVPRLAATLLRVKKRSRGLNYGSNRVRFTGQVPAGSRVRLRQKIKSVEPVEGGGVRITSESTMEVEGADPPGACRRNHQHAVRIRRPDPRIKRRPAVLRITRSRFQEPGRGGRQPAHNAGRKALCWAPSPAGCRAAARI